MEPKCNLQVGLFIKRQCNRPAKHTCNKCGISVCSAHAKQINNEVICAKCYREVEEFESEYQLGYNDNPFFLYAWYSMHRDTFYHDHDYSPFDESDYDGFSDMAVMDYDDNISDDSYFDS